MPDGSGDEGRNAPQRRRARRRGLAGVPAHFVYNRSLKIYLAPWDVPDPTSTVRRGCRPPKPPGKREACEAVHDYYGCERCKKYDAALANWRIFAKPGLDRCYHPTCAQCEGRVERDDEFTPASTAHRRWERRDPETGKCRLCNLKMGGTYDEGVCDCVWCDYCAGFYLRAEYCRACSGHTSCTGTQRCRCTTCERCDMRRTADRMCTDCSACTTCCQCVRCANCSALATRRPLGTNENCPHVCQHCPVCADCRVSLTPYVKSAEVFHRLAVGPQTLKMFDRNPVKRLMGAEVEAYASQWLKVGKVMKKWGGGIVEDGSIRPVGGRDFEVNTAPAMGSLFVNQMNELGEAFAAHGVQSNTSCGVHVHVDASSYKWWDMRKLIRLYERVEDEMYAVCAPYRSWGRYSLKCGRKFYDWFVLGVKEPKRFKAKVMEGLYGLGPIELTGVRAKRAVENATSIKSNGHRYNSLNIHSWFLRGTVEFRHYHGSTNVENITNWAIVCGTLITLAEKLSDADIDAVPTAGTWLRQQMPSAIADWMAARTVYMTQMETRAVDEQQELLCRRHTVSAHEYLSRVCCGVTAE